mmetsp:Transcript_39827/g.81575  ORF Transcript_39827/g.81575 Transcript_39827/m.81575 type:complete len:90 (-) Transcript_39827:181-450(-)
MAQLHSEHMPTLRVPVVNQMLTRRPSGTSPSLVVLRQRYHTHMRAAMKVQMYIRDTHHQDWKQRPLSDHESAVITSAVTYRMEKVTTHR